MAKQNKDTFILRHDFFPQIKMLSMEQRGQLLTAIYAYATEEELPEMDQLTTLCFGFIRSSLDANASKYFTKCEQNRVNGQKGGRPNKPNGFEENRTVSKKTERFLSKPTEKHKNPIDSDSDSDIESESEFDSVSVSESETREEEREKFFEIFFFRNFRNPTNEVERFINHYQATGWMRKGEKVIDKAALARAWTEEKTTEPPRYPPAFMACWQDIHSAIPCKNKNIMLTALQSVEITRERITLTVSDGDLCKLMEEHLQFVKPILNRHYPNRGLHYRVPRS